MDSKISAAAGMSVETSVSLIERAKARDREAWKKLAKLYSPMVYRWARKAGLQEHDSQDIVQCVFLAVSTELASFRRDRPGDSFRGWLWTVTNSKILDHFRERARRVPAAGGSAAHQQIQQIAIPELSAAESNSEKNQLAVRIIEMLREEFEAHVWESFIRIEVHGDRPAHVAKDLGVSVSTVYRSRHRVQARLQAELESF